MTIENTRQAANRLASEARRRKSAQELAQNTAQAVRQQVSNISPEAARSLGAAMDPSQGFSLDPDARPPDLPEPGSAPGGAPERRTGNMFAGNQMADQMADQAVQASQQPLQDDHDALVGQGIGGPAAPPQQPARAREPVVKPGPKLQHPILAQLREDLGLESTRPVDVKVGNHSWTLATLTPGDLATASRLADQLSVGQVETRLIYETAVVAHAVMAVDSVPTYQVFGIEPTPGTHVTNPLRPPRAVRYMAAGRLFDFIQDEARTQLGSRLYEAYLDKVDDAGAVRSYLDDPMHRKVTFRCGQAGCGHEIVMVPRYRPGTRDIVLPFCQWHAEPMEVVEQEVDGPLA